MLVDHRVTIKDANELLPIKEFQEHLRKGVNVAHIADWLRWVALYEYGGWWSDMDVVCLRKLPVHPVRMFQTIPLKRAGVFSYKRKFYSNPALGRPHNSVFKVPSGDPLMKHMIEFTSTFIRKLRKGIAQGTAWDVFIFEFGAAQVRMGYEKFVAPPLLLAPLYNGVMPREDTRSWFGNTLPGYADIRKHSFVADFWGQNYDDNDIKLILETIDPAWRLMTGNLQ